MNDKLIIYLGPKGYNITTDGITPMEFVDGENTIDIVDEKGKPDLKEAILICTRHEYGWELI